MATDRSELRRVPGRGRRLALALAVACLFLLAAVPAALAGWPDQNTPLGWKGFTNGAPSMWATGIPVDFTNQLDQAIDLVQYGDTYMYYVDNGFLYYQAWQLSTQGGAPVALGSGGLAIPINSSEYIGACATGTDVYVFFRAGQSTLGWTQASENYGTVHSTEAWWVGALTYQIDESSITTADFMVGDVVQLDDAFAFVSPDFSGQSYNVFLTDLSGSNDIASYQASFTPGADAGASPGSSTLRDVSAIPFSYQGETYLAVASLFGTPGGQEQYWGTAVTPWTNMQAGVYLSAFDAQGFATPVVQKQFFQPSAPPWETPWYPSWGEYGMTPPDSGPVNIRLVRGGAQNGPKGDQLTVLLRTCSAAVESTGNVAWYTDFQPEIFSNYQMAVSGSQPTPSLAPPSAPDWAWQPRTAEFDNNDNSFLYQNCTATNFFALPVSLLDYGGPSTQSTASPSFPYQSWRQYVFFATSADLTLYEQTGSKSSYTGVVGSVGCLASDKLQPVAQDTTDDAGQALSTPTVYPFALTNIDMSAPNADPSQCTLNGVSYGPPPLALNGWTWESLRPASQSAATSTWVQFGTDQSTDTQSTNENTGGVTAGFEKKGLITKFTGSAGWQIDQSTTHDRSSSVQETWQCLPGVTASYDHYGQMFFKQPVFELQRFARLDWSGTAIPNEYLMATNCVDATGVEGAFSFNMTSPGTPDANAPLNAGFAGMTAAPATSDYVGWSERDDPLTMAGSHGAAVKLPDGSPVQVSWTGQPSADVQIEKTFASSTAITKTMSNTISAQASEKVAWFVSTQNYAHTWTSDTTTSAGQSFQCGWQLPVQGVIVPNLAGYTAADAAAQVAATGLVPTVIYDAAISGANGKVFAQSLTAGTTAYAGAEVVLSIIGPQPATPLPMPPPAVIPADVESMTIEGYWMEATDDQAYWIPDAYSAEVNGQSQKPWCVDWSVVAYASGSSPSARAADRACDVKVRARPVRGGTVHVLGSQTAGGHFARAGADGVLITATPADGYRFAGWQLHGRDVATLRGVRQQSARVTPKKAGGGVTATARFVRIVPKDVELVRRGADEVDLRIDGAPLSRRYAGPVTRATQVTLVLGDVVCEVPRSSWKRVAGGVFAASFQPRAWKGHGGRLSLRLDTAADRWSLRANGATQAGSLLRGAAAGHLPVTLRAGGKPLTHETLPVACRARFAAKAPGKRAAYTMPNASVLPVDLRRATVRTTVRGDDYRRTRLLVSGVRVDPELLRRTGFDLQLNGLKAHIGVAKKDGAQLVARGRTVQGIGIICRWTTGGRLSLTLGGGYLERELGRCVAPNIELTIGRGDTASTGTMVLTAARISPLSIAPRLAGD